MSGMCIVQVGANRGNDHVTQLVKQGGVETLLLIEPTPQCIPILRECYSSVFPNAIIEEVAVVPTKTEEYVEFFWTTQTPLPEPTYETNTLKREHLVKTGVSESEVRVTKVKAETLDTILARHGIQKIDRLYIDIEGMDAEVLLTFPFDKYNVGFVQAETLHMGGAERTVLQYMKGHGFNTIRGTGMDTMYTRG